MSTNVHTSTNSQIVVLDKTRDPELGRLGYPLLPTSQAYASYLQRRNVNIVLIHLADINAEDCLYLHEVNALFQGSLIYFGINSDRGEQVDQAARALIGRELHFEKFIPKTHNRQQIDYLINFYQKRRTLENQLHSKPRPNAPMRDKRTTHAEPFRNDFSGPVASPAFGTGASDSLIDKFLPFKTTHFIFLCLLISGVVTLSFIANLFMSPPTTPPNEIVARPAQAQAPQTSQPVQAPQTETLPAQAQSATQDTAGTIGQPGRALAQAEHQNINQGVDQIPRLPTALFDTTLGPSTAASQNNTPSPYSVPNSPQFNIRTPKQPEPEKLASKTNNGANSVPAAKTRQTDASQQPVRTTVSATTPDAGSTNTAPINVLNTPEIATGDIVLGRATPKNDSRKSTPTKNKSDKKQTAQTKRVTRTTEQKSTASKASTQIAAKTTPTKASTASIKPTQKKTKSAAQASKPKPKPSTKPKSKPTVPKLAILTSGQKNKISEYNTMAITQIQQKVYLPASRKSALHFFNKIYEIAGPNRTAKSLANNITGNILKDANEAIKHRNALKLERAIDNLRAFDNHIRSFTANIHTQASYQRLLNRYHETITRSEPILTQEMDVKKRNEFRSALKKLRRLITDICQTCTARA